MRRGAARKCVEGGAPADLVQPGREVELLPLPPHAVYREGNRGEERVSRMRARVQRRERRTQVGVVQVAEVQKAGGRRRQRQRTREVEREHERLTRAGR